MLMTFLCCFCGINVIVKDSYVLFRRLHICRVRSLKVKANINISRGQKPLIEINLFRLSVSGMMHSQIAFRGAIVEPAAGHSTRKEPRPEMTANLHVNTHLSAALEQRWEG